MTHWTEYHTPTSVSQALALLEQYGDDAELVAGGTDLILDLQYNGHAPVHALIDVTAIDGLNTVRDEGDSLVIGAAVTHAQIERDPRLREHATAMVESCSVVGGPQVRNVATIGGNVAHALPAADGTIGLLALNADVQVCTLTDGALDCAWQPLLSIFAGPGRNNLAKNQMLSAFRVPKRRMRQASAFDRIMRPQGVALPILGVAASLTVDDSATRVAHAAIAVGPAGPIPFRATDAEEVLTSAGTFDDDVIATTVAAAQAQALLRTSKHRATKEYRHEMIGVLLGRVLRTAFARASSA